LPTAIELFLSYSHNDEDFRAGLVEHLTVLQREGLVTAWHDRQIRAGADWKHEIDSHLLSAGMVLLLVSPSFIASEYCYGIELATALDRHDKQGLPIVPVLLRPVEWRGMPFARFQALPRNGKPVSEWRDRDAAFRDIVSGIRNTLSAALEAGVIAAPQWWRLTRGVSWTSVAVAVTMLTFLTRVYFSIATPADPLTGRDTFIAFVFWSGLCTGAKYIVDRFRRTAARRRSHPRAGPVTPVMSHDSGSGVSSRSKSVRPGPGEPTMEFSKRGNSCANSSSGSSSF